MPTEPAMPLPPPPAPPPMVEPPVSEPPVTEVPVPLPPTVPTMPTDPTDPTVPTMPTVPFAVVPPTPGLISFVPGISRTAATDAPAPSPLVDHIPGPLRPADTVVAGETPLAADLAEDVESTRMVAERVAAATPASAGPSAVLRLWDGRRLTLSGTALMGRDPTPRDGEPAPAHRLTLDDPVRSVSKTHLAVGVDAYGVWVRDRGSTNGTVVTYEGKRVECRPHEEVRVPRGATVAFGRYWFTVG